MANDRTSSKVHRILIVGDDRFTILTLRRALADLRCTVAVALDVPSAVEIARAFHPDIALLDIGLSVADGYEFAPNLRDLSRTFHSHVRLVALVGSGPSADLSRAADAGFERHLSKPVDIDELADLMHQLRVEMP